MTFLAVNCVYPYCFSSPLVVHTTVTMVPTWCQRPQSRAFGPVAWMKVPAFTLSSGMLQSTPKFECVSSELNRLHPHEAEHTGGMRD